jgi:hypothetical protein
MISTQTLVKKPIGWRSLPFSRHVRPRPRPGWAASVKLAENTTNPVTARAHATTKTKFGQTTVLPPRSLGPPWLCHIPMAPHSPMAPLHASDGLKPHLLCARLGVNPKP